MTTFLRKFIRNYLHIAAPLNTLLKKDTVYKWTNVHQESFDALKKALISKPILQLPEFNKPFMLYTDASSIAVGYILCQKNDDGRSISVVEYGGRSLHDTESRYSSSELELLGIIYALRQCRIYLSNVQVDIFTDNKALTYLHTMKHTNDRLYRWSIELENYDYNVTYQKRKNEPG